MVLLDESHTFWPWPLRQSTYMEKREWAGRTSFAERRVGAGEDAERAIGSTSGTKSCGDGGRASWLWPFGQPARAGKRELADGDAERAWDLADRAEMGQASELLRNFVRPLPRAQRLWKFRIERSPDMLEYRLACDGGFLVLAKVSPSTRHVRFYLYDPLEENGSLHSPDRPAFTMTCEADRKEWRLVQERSDNEAYSPWHSAGCSRARREVAYIQHCRRWVGDAINHFMDVRLPPDGQHFDEDQWLVTRMPKWNEKVNSMTLDFKGRNVLSSEKNFQLCLEERPDHTICQYGKLGPHSFGLDFMYPLSVIQAFGISITTLMWD